MLPEFISFFKGFSDLSWGDASAPPNAWKHLNKQLAELLQLLMPLWEGRSGDWHELEERCRHAGVILSGILLSLAIWRHDAKAVNERCSICQRRLKKHWTSRMLKTTCGLVPAFRRKVSCRCGKLKRHVPADAALALPAYDKMSPALAVWVAKLGASLSFALAAHFFLDWLGQEVVSAKGAHDQCGRLGSALTEIPDVPPATTPSSMPERVVVDGDAAVVGLHRTAKKDPKDSRFELWTGRVYERHEQDYAGVHLYRHLCFGGGCNRAGDDVTLSLFGLVARRFPQVIGERPVYVRGDGAKLLDSLSKMFPKGKRLLDLYHTLVKVSERVKEAFPALPFRERRAIGDELSERLRAGDAAGILTACERLKAHPALVATEPLERLADHIRRHHDHIWYPEAKQFGLGVGTAIAEKDVDLVLDRRFELRGMTWSPRGARNTLRIRLTLFNDTPSALQQAAK